MFVPLRAEVDDWQEQDWPWATYALLAVIVVAYLVLWLYLDTAQRTLAMIRFGAVKFAFRDYMPLTCTLLHAGIVHLLGNALFLFIYGSGLERAIGWWKFLTIYLVGAFVSVHVQLWTMTPLQADNPVVGASGAIAGVLGAYLVLLPTSKIDTLFFSIISFRPIHIKIPAWIVLGLWFVSQLVYCSGLLGELEGVAFWAHTAGFVAGAVVGTLYQHQRLKAIRGYLVGAKEPLLAAWRTFLGGDRAGAAAQAATLSEQPILGAQGGQQLLNGLLADDQQASVEALSKAFEQAADYRDAPRQLTVYLQLLRIASPFGVQPGIHRDAAFVAQGLKQHQLALMAFHYAILTGEEERLPQVLRALEGIVGVRLERPELAAEVAAVRQELEA